MKRAAAVGLAMAALSTGACRSSTTQPNGSGAAGAASSSDSSAFGSSDANMPPPPVITIDNRAPGQFALRAGAPVNLATKAVIERRADDGQWTALDSFEGGKGYRLVTSCDEVDTPSCRSLGAGDVFVPVPWNGYSCSSQCNANCDKNVIASGVHRLVVSACDDPKRRYQGLPFEVPSQPEMLARQQATSDVVRATICRLDAQGAVGTTHSSPSEAEGTGDAGGSRGTDRRAGFKVVPGSEKVLEVDGRSELVKWLRNHSGFKEGAMNAKQGCKHRHMVGFSLTSSAAPGHEATAEIAVDFGCNVVKLVHQDGGRGGESWSTFDPSRSVILGIAGRGFPADSELGRLQ